ncbi:sigma factor-like helix-turn-helix DNA-binding protein [Aquisphaera insulae]|uniref:sigma factor-like helix-turn-helix DNA-binding protein n=1 Tax=Aquisphaera insulae TaxID=2712864 RepID=UPI0013EACD6D|nr:sigma factor-like helix-turn-helix DNA-binding protein [Aquisphaera insulae]
MTDQCAEIMTLVEGVRAGDEHALADLLAEYRSVQASPEKQATRMADLTSPSLAIERMEAIERVRRVLERLEPFDREILALGRSEERTNQQVASTLDINPPAASQRDLRALDRLRQVLEAAGGPEGGAG